MINMQNILSNWRQDCSSSDGCKSFLSQNLSKFEMVFCSIHETAISRMNSNNNSQNSSSNTSKDIVILYRIIRNLCSVSPNAHLIINNSIENSKSKSSTTTTYLDEIINLIDQMVPFAMKLVQSGKHKDEFSTCCDIIRSGCQVFCNLGLQSYTDNSNWTGGQSNDNPETKDNNCDCVDMSEKVHCGLWEKLLAHFDEWIQCIVKNKQEKYDELFLHNLSRVLDPILAYFGIFIENPHYLKKIVCENNKKQVKINEILYNTFVIDKYYFNSFFNGNENDKDSKTDDSDSDNDNDSDSDDSTSSDSDNGNGNGNGNGGAVDIFDEPNQDEIKNQSKNADIANDALCKDDLINKETLIQQANKEAKDKIKKQKRKKKQGNKKKIKGKQNVSKKQVGVEYDHIKRLHKLVPYFIEMNGLLLVWQHNEDRFNFKLHLGAMKNESSNKNDANGNIKGFENGNGKVDELVIFLDILCQLTEEILLETSKKLDSSGKQKISGVQRIEHPDHMASVDNSSIHAHAHSNHFKFIINILPSLIKFVKILDPLLEFESSLNVMKKVILKNGNGSRIAEYLSLCNLVFDIMGNVSLTMIDDASFLCKISDIWIEPCIRACRNLHRLVYDKQKVIDKNGTKLTQINHEYESNQLFKDLLTLRRYLVCILCNLTSEDNISGKNNEYNQNLVRLHGGIELLLNLTKIDHYTLFLQQWSILVIRNITQNNIENQKYIYQIQNIDKLIPNEQLDKMGFKLVYNELNGKISIEKIDKNDDEIVKKQL